MRVRNLILTTTALLLWSPGAVAEEREESEPDFARSGFYLVFGGAATLDTIGGGFFNPLVTDSGGLYGEVGIRFWRYLTAEIEFTWIRGADQFTVIPGFRGYFLTGRIQPFVELGVGPFYADLGPVSGWGGRVKAGGGIDFYISPSWVIAVNADYLHGTGTWHGFNEVGLGFGAMHRF